MNRNFVKMLQSVAEAEKDPRFSSKNYDVADVKPMYPENVIVVASPTGNAPPRAPGETRVDRLSYAVLAAFLRASVGLKRCSIVVHEGVYLDPLKNIPTIGEPPGILKDFSLEIIGVKNVRLIFETHGVTVSGVKLTLRNLLVYDRRRMWNKEPIFHVHLGASADFIDVKIHDQGRCAVVLHRTSKVVMHGCIIYGSWKAITAVECDVYLSESVFSDISGMGVTIKDGKLEANRITFANCDRLGLLLLNSHGTIANCHFKGTFDIETYDPYDMEMYKDKDQQGLAIQNGSQFTFTKTTFEGLQAGLLSSGTNTKPTVRNCNFTHCFWAFSLDFNSDGVFEKCHLHCEFVLRMAYNVNGQINFCKNKMRRGARPKFITDSQSVSPRHDFKGLRTMTHDHLQVKTYEKPTRKEHSEFTKRSNADMTIALSDPDFPRYHKMCRKCLLPETESSTKFKYCKRCEKVVYCSKKCQINDWPDHQLAC